MRRNTGIALVLCLLLAGTGAAADSTLDSSLDSYTTDADGLYPNASDTVRPAPDEPQQSLTEEYRNVTTAYNRTESRDSRLDTYHGSESDNPVRVTAASDTSPQNASWYAEITRSDGTENITAAITAPNSTDRQPEGGWNWTVPRWTTGADRSSNASASAQADIGLQRAKTAIDRAEQHREALNRTVTRLADLDIDLTDARSAVKTAGDNLSQARTALETARTAARAENYSAAERDAERAWAHATAADRRLQEAAAGTRTGISGALETRIAQLRAEVAAEQRRVERLEERYGERSPQARRAREDLRDAEEALDRSEQNQEEAESASTVEELAESSTAAADETTAAADSLQRTRKTVEDANRTFYQHLQAVGVLAAILAGGGFLYYRIDRDEWKEKESWASDD